MQLDQIYSKLPEIIPGVLAQISEIARCIHCFGWAEANSGNLSVNITDELIASGLIASPDDERYFLVSGTGTRYRQMQYDALSCLILIRVTALAEEMYPENCRPTSEWISHISLQNHFHCHKLKHKVIIHAHATEAIAFSNNPLYGSGDYLQSELFRVLPELKFYLPEGIGMCGYYEPGSTELCDATLSCIGNKKAMIWQKHGVLGFGKTIDEAFDYLELVNKATKVWITINSYT